MLEPRKVDNNKIRKALFVNLRPLHNYVTGTRYSENIPEVSLQVRVRSVVNE